MTRRNNPATVLVQEQRTNGGLTPLERETVDFFVRMSRLLGQPASLGQLYGLLFISAKPMAMDELVKRLGISKGSASQGLRFLHELGAIRKVALPEDRRVHYEAVAQLRKLAARFLQERVEPRLRDGCNQLNRMSALADKLPEAEATHARNRIRLLRSWTRNGRRVLPIILRVLGTSSRAS
ncbi:MAG: MarR family transcriptional regulator [Verrucomicrobiota bacterium]|nr:MarR family transcriptional regulator [Limisphaera sp.]MDW8381078.1 MarR family transcriptional regulator [Verrucomicrobiota bacterium]